MENYYRELVSVLSARMGNAHAAEDVVHDAYVRVLDRSGTTITGLYAVGTDMAGASTSSR